MYSKFIVGDFVEIDNELFIILAVYLLVGSEQYYYLSNEDRSSVFIYRSIELSKIITKHVRKYQYNNDLYCDRCCDLKQLIDEDCKKDCINSYEEVKDYYFIGDEVTLTLDDVTSPSQDSTIIAIYFNIYSFLGNYKKEDDSCFGLYFKYNYVSGEFKNICKNFLRYFPAINLSPLFNGKSILPYLTFCYRCGYQDPVNLNSRLIHLKKKAWFYYKSIIQSL